MRGFRHSILLAGRKNPTAVSCRNRQSVHVPGIVVHPGDRATQIQDQVRRHGYPLGRQTERHRHDQNTNRLRRQRGQPKRGYPDCYRSPSEIFFITFRTYDMTFRPLNRRTSRRETWSSLKTS